MKKIIIYNLKEKENKIRSRILQKLYGYVDKSNKGQYTYQRKGELDQTKYKKETKTVLYFRTLTNQKKAAKILKEHEVKIQIASL